jgi:hypothetical protein
MHYQKFGTWMTFNQYQKVGDKTCKENVFTQVLDEMRLDVVFNRPEAVKAPSEPAAQPKNPPPAPPPAPKPPNTALAAALANGLEKTAKERPKGPVTAMRRQEAEAWIKEHLDYGIAQFKNEFPEPELDNAWWSKIRNNLLHPPEQQENRVSITADSITFDPRMKEDARKAVRYMITLSPDKIEGLTPGVYTEKTRHKIEGPAFQSAKRFVRALLAGTSKRAKMNARAAAAPGQSTAAPAQPREPKPRKTAGKASGKLYETLAELDLAAFSTCKTTDLKAFALELVKTLHPRGAEAQVRILTDPASMEIRVPA